MQHEHAGTIAGTYYDGVSAQAHPVTLEVSAAVLTVRGAGIERSIPLSRVTLSERLGNTPRVLNLPEGASVVLSYGADARHFEDEEFRWSDLLAWLESRWLIVAASLVVVIATLAAAYLWLLPAAADAIAARLPDRAIARAGDETLELLEEKFLEPSKLEAARTQTILTRLAAMKQPAEAVPKYSVLFRDAPRLGANAFALPNGTIVVTDKLVELARSDDEVLAVVGHEIGHVQRRHMMRQIMRGSLLALFITWWTGDLGTTAVMLSTAFLETGYSRDFEREADDYGAGFLRANGLSPVLLGNMLQRLEESHQGSSAPSYLSTHPSTRERIERLQRGD